MGREEHCKQITLVCACSVSPSPAHGVCALPVYTAEALGCSAGDCLRLALGCMHFSGLSCSGSDTRVLLKGLDSVGPVFCALPRSEQLSPGTYMQTRARLRQFQAEKLRAWAVSTMKALMPWAGANPVWLRHCEHAHTCQWYLFAVFLPPHSTPEQVSLNKWPPLPPCVRVDIRHWRDLQTEVAKINRGNRFGSDRCNRLKPCS